MHQLLGCPWKAGRCAPARGAGLGASGLPFPLPCAEIMNQRRRKTFIECPFLWHLIGRIASLDGKDMFTGDSQSGKSEPVLGLLHLGGAEPRARPQQGPTPSQAIVFAATSGLGYFYPGSDLSLAAEYSLLRALILTQFLKVNKGKHGCDFYSRRPSRMCFMTSDRLPGSQTTRLPRLWVFLDIPLLLIWPQRPSRV